MCCPSQLRQPFSVNFSKYKIAKMAWRGLAHQFFADEITRFTDFYPILLGLIDYRPKLSAPPELFFPGRSSLEILRSRTGIEVGLE